ncbi:N-acetylglucosaminyl-diphospho-decaprenol L-rhamnosyltransferase [soil metagenome]
MAISEGGVQAQDATAVLVNYNSGGRLEHLLDLLTEEVRAIVVVDNASSDGSLSPAERRAGTQVIRNEVNRGFAAAVNQGAVVGETEWLLLVNPDAHIRRGDVTRLLSGVPEDVAAIAPLQVDEAARPRSETGGFEPSLFRYLVWAVLPVRFHRGFGPWLAPPFPTADTDVDWVSGALLGIRRHVFVRLGGLDERYFLYHEDVDFARRARKLGYRILCRPTVRLFHEVAHGEPSRRVASGLRSVESLSLDFSGWRRRALGLVLGLGYGLRAMFATGTTRDLSRAVLPQCRRLIRGEPAVAGPQSLRKSP